MNLREELENLSKRYIDEELDYIWDYCKKYDFAKYIKSEQDIENLEKLVVYYGFLEVQQAIRKINKRDLKYPLITLKDELYKATVDKKELERIPAYRDAMVMEYNKKINKEIEMFYGKELEKLEERAKDFNNFQCRDRQVDNEDGYLTFEEIENKLLGWE